MKSSIFIGFSIIFTIHFGGKIPLFLVQHPNMNGSLSLFSCRKSWQPPQAIGIMESQSISDHDIWPTQRIATWFKGNPVDGSEIRLTIWYGKYPTICRVLGPSQVVVWDACLIHPLLWLFSRFAQFQFCISDLPRVPVTHPNFQLLLGQNGNSPPLS